MEKLLKEYKTEVKNNAIKGIVRILLSLILGFVFIFVRDLFVIGVICLFLTIFFVLSLIFTAIMNKEIYLTCSKKKKIKFKKLEVSHNKFIEACKEGLPDDTYIKVNDRIFSICAQKNNYYINFMKFNSLEQFLYFQFEGKIYLSNLKKVTFLQVSGNDPRNYFEEEK